MKKYLKKRVQVSRCDYLLAIARVLTRKKTNALLMIQVLASCHDNSLKLAIKVTKISENEK